MDLIDVLWVLQEKGHIELFFTEDFYFIYRSNSVQFERICSDFASKYVMVRVILEMTFK